MTFPLDERGLPILTPEQAMRMAAYAIGREDARLGLYRHETDKAVERLREARKEAEAGSSFAEMSLDPLASIAAAEFERFAGWRAIRRLADVSFRWRKRKLKDETLLAELEEARRRGYESAWRGLADEEAT
jgi:predicted N-acetyltransferase YhbS